MVGSGGASSRVAWILRAPAVNVAQYLPTSVVNLERVIIPALIGSHRMLADSTGWNVRLAKIKTSPQARNVTVHKTSVLGNMGKRASTQVIMRVVAQAAGTHLCTHADTRTYRNRQPPMK